MRKNIKIKALSALIALLIFSSAIFSIMPFSIAAVEGTETPLKPGVVDVLFDTLSNYGQLGNKTWAGGSFSNLSDFATMFHPYFFYGPYIQFIDSGYWGPDSPVAENPLGLYDGKNVDRYITYPVRDNVYFAFNTITGTNYTVGALQNLIYNDNGMGWRLEISYDGKNFENLPYDNVFQGGAYDWIATPDPYNPGKMLTPPNNMPPACSTAETSSCSEPFNVLDYIAEHASTPDERLPIPERDHYCLITHVHKIPAHVTHVRVVFPSPNLVYQYDSVTGDAHAGLWSQSLTSVKVSRSKIDSTSLGDEMCYYWGDTYDDPEYSVKNSYKDSVIFVKENLFVDDNTISDISVANAKNFFNTRMAEVKFYTAEDELITDTTTKLADGMKAKFFADVSYPVAGFNDGDLINEYKITISERKNPEFVFKGNSIVKIDGYSITINQKMDAPDFTYQDLKDCYDITYGDIAFFETDGETPITDLSLGIAPDVIAKFVTKDCPGHLDGDVIETYDVSMILQPIYLTPPETSAEAKLVLKPGVADRFNLIADPDTGAVFSAYAALENSGALNFLSNDTTYLTWLSDMKNVFDKDAHTVLQYLPGASNDINPAVIYKVVPESYISAVFIIGSGATTAKDMLDSINDVKFYSSADGTTWEEIEEDPYQGCIASSIAHYVGDIKLPLKNSYNDGKGVNNASGWSQVLFSAKVPAGSNYIKIQMPNTTYQKELSGMQAFVDPANGDYTLDETKLFTWCTAHAGWCYAESENNHIKLGTGEGKGAIVSDPNGAVFPQGCSLAMVKASSTPISFDPASFILETGDSEYVNDYDAAEYIINNNKFSVSGNEFIVRRFSNSEVVTYQDILDSLTLHFAEVKFYTDSTKTTQITDFSQAVKSNAHMDILVKGHKIPAYYPNGSALGSFKIVTTVLKNFPSLVENGDLYTVDHEQKVVSFKYYMDEGAPTYGNILNLLKGNFASFKFQTIAGGYVDTSLEASSNYAKILICAYNCEGFANGDIYTTYDLVIEPVLKDVSVESLDTSKIEIDDNGNQLIIHSDSLTIADIENLLKKNNCTLLFSLLQPDGSFEPIVDYSLLANTDVYLDLLSTVDSRTYSYFLSFDVVIEQVETEKTLTVPDIENLSVDDFSSVVAFITEYNQYYYQFDDAQRAYYESAIELLKTKMDNLFIAQQIAELTAGLPATLTSSNVNTVLLIEKCYASLFTEIRDSLDSSITAQIANFKEQVGKIIQTDNGVTISGLKWNIRVKVKGLSKTDEAYLRVNPKVSGTNLLSLFEVEFYDILNNKPFVLEEDKVISISLPTKDLDGYENLLGLYERTDGKLSYLQATLDDEFITFKVKAFNSIGIVGSEPFPVLAVVLASIGGLIVLAGAAVLTIFLVKNKKKAKGGTEE